MIKKIFILILFACVIKAQTFTPSKKDVNYSWAYTHQVSGDTLAPMVYVMTGFYSSDITIDSAATESDTTDIGSVRKILGIYASSTFDSSATTFDIALSGTALFNLWSETALFSIKLDSSGIVYFTNPFYARFIKVKFTAQNSSATITLIYE